MPESKLTSAKVRLTVFVSTLTIGGAEQLLLDFLAEINQDKFDLFVCFLKDPGILGHELIRSGVPAVSNLLERRFDPTTPFKLARILSARHTDLLLLINHRDALFYGVPAARIAGINAIVNWINETHKKYSSHRLTMLGRKILHLGVSKVVAAASGHAEYLASVEGISRSKLEVIYNGVDIDRCRSGLTPSQAKEKTGIPASCPTISMIAALRPDKDHGVFLQAARIVLESFPNTHYLIVGDGPMKPCLITIARELGIFPNTHFLGFRRDIQDILAGTDICVLATKPEQETLSVAVIESMIAGIPIVCTDVGFMKEIIRSEETGLLVKMGDHRDLAEKIKMLLNDAPLRCRIGKAAQEFALAKLTQECMTQAFEVLFLNLLGREHIPGGRFQ